MSRFPVNNESGGQPLEAARRSTAIQLPTTSLVESRNAPGLETPPPVSEGAMLAAQLGEVLGAAGQAADAIRIENARKQAEAERLEARRRAEAEYAERNAEALAAAQRGDGARLGAVQLADNLLKINTGEIPRDNSLTAAQQAEAVVAGLVKDLPPDQAEGYRRAVTDAYANTLADVDGKRIAEARETTLKSAETAAVLAKDPAELAAAFKTAKATKVGDVKAASATYLVALQAAAQQMSTKQFDMIADAMPAGMFELEKSNARQQLEQNIQHAQDKVYNTASDQVGKELYAIERNEFGASFENARSTIESYRPFMAGDQLDTLLQRVNHREAQANADLLQKYDDDDRALLTNEHTRLLDAAGDAGVLFDVRPLEARTRRGTSVRMSREDGIELATDRAFARIAQEEKDPIVRLRRQADWAAKNGVQPGDWERILAAGFTASSDIAVVGAKDGQLPPATIAGVELFRQLSAVSPANLSRLVKDQKSFEFYDAVQTAMSLPEIGSPESAANPQAASQRLGQAIATARRATFDSPVIKVRNAEIESETEQMIGRGWFRADAGNSGEIANQVDRQARIYAAMGIPPKEAVAKARKNIETNRLDINGWYVNIAGVPLSPEQRKELPGIADEIFSRYVKAHPESGLSTRDLTLRNDRRTGLWVLTEKASGITPANPKGPEWVYFSGDDLSAVKGQMKAEQDKITIDKQLALMAKYEPETGSFLGFTRQSGKLSGMIYKLESRLVMNENRQEIDAVIKKLDVLIPLRDEIQKLDSEIARGSDAQIINKLKARRQELFSNAAAVIPKD